VIDGAAGAYGVDHEVLITGRAVTITPDEELVDRVLSAAGSLDALPQVLRHAPQGGSDDVNLMIQGVQQAGGQGAYINVGAGSPAPHHNPYFDPDERSIGTAIDLLEALFRAG
jgi:aminobenzoyl-glutamate utilization protein A